MSSVLTDFDLARLPPDDVLRLWQRVQAVKAPRADNPKLRQAVLARLDGLEPALAAQIRDELDAYGPELVLGAHWRQLVPDGPALGSFPKPAPAQPRTLTDQIAADHDALAVYVCQMWRFAPDPVRVAGAATQLADAAGVPEPEADRIIADAIRRLRSRGAGHAS